MSANANNIITTVERLDSYINWITENNIIATDKVYMPDFSQEMERLYDLYNVIRKLAENQNQEQAIKKYAELLNRYPNFIAARYNMAHDLKDLGKFEESLEQYLTAAQYNPNDPDIYIELGMYIAEQIKRVQNSFPIFRLLS